MEFLWYSLYVGSLYNNDTSNTRSANTVGVVLFCPVSNESSTFVALSIFVLYHIVYQSRIYIFDRFWPSRILYYIHHYPVVQYIFLSRLCYAITLEIFSIVCVLSSLLSSLLHHSNIIFGISSSINHISRGEIDTRERENSQPARMKPILVYHYELDIPLNHVCYEETRSVHEISAEFSTLSLSLSCFFRPTFSFHARFDNWSAQRPYEWW